MSDTNLIVAGHLAHYRALAETPQSERMRELMAEPQPAIIGVDLGRPADCSGPLAPRKPRTPRMRPCLKCRADSVASCVVEFDRTLAWHCCACGDQGEARIGSEAARSRMRL